MTSKFVPCMAPLGWTYYYVPISGLKQTTIERVLGIMEGLGLESELLLQLAFEDVAPLPVLMFYMGQGEPSEELEEKCKALDDALVALGEGCMLVMNHGNGLYEQLKAMKARAKQKAVAV